MTNQGPGDKRIDPAVLGRRLRDARQARDLKQEDVARELGLARTTLVAVEKGERRVNPDELIQLATLYGRSIHELMRPGAPVESFSAQFRAAVSHSNTEGKQLEDAVVELQTLSEDALELERLAEAPQIRKTVPQYEFVGLDPASLGEHVAAAERSRLGLGDGPILQLREVLEEDVGLRVFSVDLPSSVAGLFAYSEAAGGCIAMNAKHPAERQRWSLAHEFGHYLTSRYRPEVTVLRSYYRVPIAERTAEAFAEHFLMPAAGLMRRFRELATSRAEGATAADLMQLAHLYQVSLQALVVRLEDLRLVRPGIWDQLHAAGFRVAEAKNLLDLSTLPPDTDIFPRRYRLLAVELYLNGSITEGQFARFLRTDRVRARAQAQQLSEQFGLTEEGEITSAEVDLGDASRHLTADPR